MIASPEPTAHRVHETFRRWCRKVPALRVAMDKGNDVQAVGCAMIRQLVIDELQLRSGLRVYDLTDGESSTIDQRADESEYASRVLRCSLDAAAELRPRLPKVGWVVTVSGPCRVEWKDGPKRTVVVVLVDCDVLGEHYMLAVHAEPDTDSCDVRDPYDWSWGRLRHHGQRGIGVETGKVRKVFWGCFYGSKRDDGTACSICGDRNAPIDTKVLPKGPVCLACYLTVHREDCGCGKWRQAEEDVLDED